MVSLRPLIVSIVLALLVPATASATTLATPDGAVRPQPFQAWVDRSAVPTPPGVVTLHLESCPGGPAWGAACADSSALSIHLGSEGRDRVTLLHELGHIFDGRVLTDADRARLQALLGRPGAWDGPAADDPPHEQFAEAYALCARHPRLRATRLGMYGYVATPARHRAVCAVIRDAAARRPS